MVWHGGLDGLVGCGRVPQTLVSTGGSKCLCCGIVNSELGQLFI